ncbi:malto-oligosyltrehalose trehalohydrolase [Yoonia sp.]|uniref:malto-oligosyltrehalose trehalohydrolase n=1 Tax=Yoonia sp. TaxID=2212373 RepID=UPI00391AD392
MTPRVTPSWGPTWLGGGRARFRLWAPQASGLRLRTDDGDHVMQSAGDGWYEVMIDNAAPGADYAFVLPDGYVVPDPASRVQANDVHSASRLVDPHSYDWRHDWRGRDWAEAVIYELHIGTFTPQGTFAAACDKLTHLAQAGFTAIEIMPVAQFEGSRGWGYDGVLPYAPHNAYGTPDDFKHLIDTAQGLGLMVLLDVVYNHFGPSGNYLHLYASDFFNPSRETPWGSAIAYEKPPVRSFFIDNAIYWLTEFRLDGLRLDAIDHIRDTSSPEILIELAARVRATIADRPVHLTTEDNRNVTHLHERGVDGAVPHYTAEWNDDFHNVAHVIATGESDGYYRDFTQDRWQVLALSLAEGFAYQGQVSPQSGTARGMPSGHLPPTAFVDFLQNHDQTGNRAFGERLIALAAPGMLHALSVIHLLSPHIPLLFMGEEYGERRPFCFFTDFTGDLADAVREGRRAEFADFAAFAGGALDHVPDPNAQSTFTASKLDWDHCAGTEGQAHLATVKKLLTLRHQHIVPLLSGASGGAGRVISHGDGMIAVDWALHGGTLQLRANLDDRPHDLPAATGAPLFATHPGTGKAPAYAVAFHLDMEAAQ